MFWGKKSGLCVGDRVGSIEIGDSSADKFPPWHQYLCGASIAMGLTDYHRARDRAVQCLRFNLPLEEREFALRIIEFAAPHCLLRIEDVDELAIRTTALLADVMPVDVEGHIQAARASLEKALTLLIEAKLVAMAKEGDEK